jgi:hypothetical protein
MELRRVRSAWPGGGWTWDERNGCVTSSFAGVNQAEYESIIVEVFPSRWNSRNIGRAPAELQAVVTNTGGIREGQLVFSQATSPLMFAYVLWWPWGDDATISVRIALSTDSRSARVALRELFGVELE